MVIKLDCCYEVFIMTDFYQLVTTLSNTEFTAILAKVLHRPALFAAPATLLKLAMGERACLLLEGQKVLPTKISAAGYRFQFTHLADALNDLLRKQL